MHNYYNIFPSVMLDILMIFFLEGIVFYKFIFPMEKDLASGQLNDFNDKLIQKINSTIDSYKISHSNIQDSGFLDSQTKQIINDKSREILKQNIQSIVNNEDYYIQESSKYFVFIFLLTCAGILVTIFIYYYVCKHMFNVDIDWKSILISLIFIVIGIIGFEIVYFFKIFLKKKINEKKIIKIFIDEILKK
jgi:hypothetical protein